MISDGDGRLVLLALMQLRGIGRRRAIGLVRDRSDDIRLDLWHSANTESAEAVFLEIVRLRGIDLSETQLSEIWREANGILQLCTDMGVKVISVFDGKYPKRLLEINDLAPLLYIRGNVDALDPTKAVTVVGTRNPGVIGKRISYETSQAAVASGAVVVSGLARGCDTAAHRGCLDADGITVAVLAQGLERVYPYENRDLAERIIDTGGALVAEHWPGREVGSWAFVDRDRIQSGLSDFVFVAETEKDGGTMNTARYGRNQHRPLGCYCPPAGFEESRYSGNRSMVMEMGAMSFPDAASFGKYLKTVVFV